jgi:hypothetical protein
MRWIAPSEKDNATATLEKRLWDAADQFRANSGLKSQEYSAPVLGLIFLRFAPTALKIYYSTGHDFIRIALINAVLRWSVLSFELPPKDRDQHRRLVIDRATSESK